MSTGFTLFTALATALAFGAFGVLTLYLSYANDSVSATTIRAYAALASTGVLLAILARFSISVQHSFGFYHPERILTVVGILLRTLTLGATYQTDIAYLAIPISEVAAIAVVLGGTVVFSARKGFLKHARFTTPRTQGGRALLRQSLPSFASSFSTLVAIVTPMYVAGMYLSSISLVTAAALTRVYQSARTVIGWVTLPALPEMSSSRSEDLRPSVLRSLVLSCAVAIAISAPLACFGDTLVFAWLGYTGGGSWPAAALIAFAISIHGFYAPGVIAATAIGRPGVAARFNVGWLLATSAISPVLVSSFGLIGVGLSIAAPATVFLSAGACRALGLVGLPARAALTTFGAAYASAIALLSMLRGSISALDAPPIAEFASSVGIWGTVLAAVLYLGLRKWNPWFAKMGADP